MKQKVHSVSYLAKAEFEIKEGVYNLVALPAGAEVVKVSLELVGMTANVNIGVGFKDEDTRFFLDLSNAVIVSGSCSTSTKDYTATSNKVIVAEVQKSDSDKTRGILRVLYFLPSVIEVEY
ncbi:hypothetical protein [Helicobacter pylori]|uniref:hypothetical protein n=1 Tax=Helicobacter pylori TaxID=210 RepID=UPI001C57221C|nr:hypothetical protein [Helicobacter pylori]